MPGERWLVDGLNVVGSRPDGWWRDRPAAMARLTERLERFAERTGEAVTVVFDGRAVAHGGERVEVAFVRGGPNAADREIAARVEADGDPAAMRVVTSDGDLSDRVRAAGATVVPAGSFRERLEREG